MESLAKLQKTKFRYDQSRRREERVKSLRIKLNKSKETLESDLEREKSISLDASLNEKILEEKTI